MAVTFGAGGMHEISVKNDSADVAPLRLSDDTREMLQRSLMLFVAETSSLMSEIIRNRSEALAGQESPCGESLHRVKALALYMRQALEAGDLPAFGSLLDSSWQDPGIMSQPPTPYMEHVYYTAKALGAMGGTIAGAEGRFLLLLCYPKYQPAVRVVLEALKLTEIRFALDFPGANLPAESDLSYMIRN